MKRFLFLLFAGMILAGLHPNIMWAQDCVSRTGSNMTVAFTPSIVSANFAPGDSLYALNSDRTLCVGTNTVEDSTNGFGMAVWGRTELPDGTVLDGLEPGESFQIYVLRDTIRAALVLTFETGDNTYTQDAIRNVTDIQWPVQTGEPINIGFAQNRVQTTGQWTLDVDVMPVDTYSGTETVHVSAEFVGAADSVRSPYYDSWHGQRGDTTVVSAFGVPIDSSPFRVYGTVNADVDSVRMVDAYVMDDSLRTHPVRLQWDTVVIERLRPGDLDNDGAITWTDFSALLSHVFLGGAVDEDRADLNNDGTVNFRDAVLLWKELRRQ